MYDRTDIMRRAWTHYRRVAIPNRPFDRKLFGQVLAYTWKGARVRVEAEREQAARLAQAPVIVFAKLRPMSAMEARIDALKYLSFRYSLTSAEAVNLADFTLSEGPITLNHLSLRSGLAILSGKRSGELTLSLVNRSREVQHPTVQVIVYDTTSPLPALAFSVEPLMGLIEGQATEQLSASLNMRPGELDSLVRFCVRLDG